MWLLISLPTMQRIVICKNEYKKKEKCISYSILDKLPTIMNTKRKYLKDKVIKAIYNCLYRMKFFNTHLYYIGSQI